MYVFIYLSIVDFYCSGNFISVLFGLKVGVGSDKMAATNQHFLCSIVNLWRKTRLFLNKNYMHRLRRLKLY